MPIVSFIILNYKTPHLLRLALRKLENLTMDIPYEVIVVDNDSQDGSAEMVAERYPKVTLIRNSENTGHAHGNNVGIKVAKGKYICIMNSDIIIPNPSEIEKMVTYMNDNPLIGILGPQLRNADGTVQNSCFRKYATLTPIYRRTPLGKLPFAQNDIQRHLMADFDHKEVISVDWLLGAFFMMRKEALDAVGLLNEKLFLYFADFELCDRMHNYGYDVVYYPVAHMVHYHRRESAQRSVWGGLGSLLNYTTRVHLKDWLTYKRLVNTGYDTNHTNKKSN